MRTILTISVALLVCFACGGGDTVPADEETPAVDTAPAAGQEQTFQGKGVIEAIGESSVTIAHEDIPGFMNAMTMEFELADSTLVDDMTEGTEVEFTVVVREDGTYYINSLSAVPE